MCLFAKPALIPNDEENFVASLIFSCFFIFVHLFLKSFWVANVLNKSAILKKIWRLLQISQSCSRTRKSIHTHTHTGANTQTHTRPQLQNILNSRKLRVKIRLEERSKIKNFPRHETKRVPHVAHKVKRPLTGKEQREEQQRRIDNPSKQIISAKRICLKLGSDEVSVLCRT